MTTEIPNKIIYDSKLSVSAKFLYIVLISCEEKIISNYFLYEIMKCKKDSLLKYTAELVSNWYIEKNQRKNANGSFGKSVYKIIK